MTAAQPRFEVVGLPGLPEVRPGDDLVDLLAPAVEAAPLADGDIVVVTSKIVSKAEGRVRTGVDRDEAIDAETVRTVSEWTTPRGRTSIAETRHGFVMAAAGVDASNVDPGTVVLLPEDPDASARALRDGLRRRFGVRVGVVVTDTAGRAWRNGVTDFAVGTAGVLAADDLRGSSDPYGNDLGVTVVAVADELAAASELVRGKLAGVPVALVRGLAHLVLDEDADDPGSTPLLRPMAEDRFRLGTPEAMRAAVTGRRTAQRFDDRPVDDELVRRAVRTASTAPAPDTEPVWRAVLVTSKAGCTALAEALDGADAGVARDAPCYVVPCLVRADLDALVALGAAVEGLMVALSADGLASAWLFPTPALSAAAAALDLPPGWTPAGILAVGHAAEAGDAPHPSLDDDAIVTR
ncbi:coenzyme F420-0 gamma-glutamyl ligase [Haloactinopolyspora alba]|uniref:Coenzyme F420-0 gamma-glutamyl ligase n=1 Tax=Haloactinopolyspora alba TaxID=648780 RepID=A0A2P8D3C0_9ACTN|nr:coenzyme F420-0:L-glutamate ligase [Haloactinopolyspora alba]PSK91715.1 coenzyme F420-0 gamma-glutamyl ligase [Haloactinopolyspora alba]